MEDQTAILLALLEDSGRSLHSLLTRLTLREDVAEDLMQELFMRLSRAKGFAKAQNQAAYAHRAAMHLAFDWRRSRKKEPLPVEMAVEPHRNSPSPLSRAIHDEELQRILDAAGQLGELCRDAFLMHHVQQEPYDEVAQQLHKTPHQVRALCHKALQQIRSILGAEPPGLRKEESHVRN